MICSADRYHNDPTNSQQTKIIWLSDTEKTRFVQLREIVMKFAKKVFSPRYTNKINKISDFHVYFSHRICSWQVPNKVTDLRILGFTQIRNN